MANDGVEGEMLMIVIRNYKYRINPTPDQHLTLVQWAGCRRWVWNWALRCKQEHYAATGKNLSYNELSLTLTAQKCQPDTEWLRDCSAQMLQQVLMDLDTAFTNFFANRSKYPRFKSRKNTLHSMRFPQHLYVVDEKIIRVPKIGLVGAVIHRPLQGLVKSATIKQNATGKWFVVFVCHIERPDFAPTVDHPVGIDVGLESFTTLHTGTKIKPPKFYRRGERKLKRLSRQLSRTQKGSQNRKQARKRLAKAHQRIRNQRTDWLHKQAFGIIREFDTVCIEDLNVKGLVRTKLAKSFSDAAISTFMQMLKHKAEWSGRQVIPVGRFFASSKLCHICHEKTVLTLADRVWICSNCCTSHDRDINAAINILHEGLRILAAGQSRG